MCACAADLPPHSQHVSFLNACSLKPLQEEEALLLPLLPAAAAGEGVLPLVTDEVEGECEGEEEGEGPDTVAEADADAEVGGRVGGARDGALASEAGAVGVAEEGGAALCGCGPGGPAVGAVGREGAAREGGRSSIGGPGGGAEDEEVEAEAASDGAAEAAAAAAEDDAAEVAVADDEAAAAGGVVMGMTDAAAGEAGAGEARALAALGAPTAAFGAAVAPGPGTVDAGAERRLARSAGGNGTDFSVEFGENTGGAKEEEERLFVAEDEDEVEED